MGSLEVVILLRFFVLEVISVIIFIFVLLFVNWYCYEVIKDNNRRK